MAKRRNSNTPALTDMEKKQIRMANFARVLPRRMDKAIKAIRMVGDCTLPTYSYTGVQSQAVMVRLSEALAEVGKRFEGVQGKAGGFELPA